MTNRYALSDYTVTVTVPAALISGRIGDLVLHFGGPGENQKGSFMGSITLSRSTATWSTSADATGSWIHNKTLDRTGTVALNIRQVSDDVIRLTMISQAYENDLSGIGGCTITVSAGDKVVATANDCYITKIPDKEYGNEAAEQTWNWTAGQIIFNESTEWTK